MFIKTIHMSSILITYTVLAPAPRSKWMLMTENASCPLPNHLWLDKFDGNQHFMSKSSAVGLISKALTYSFT
jgi:hypothetical protein